MSGLRTSFSLYFWDWQMLAVLRKYVWGIVTGYFYFYLHPASLSLTGHWMHRTLSRLTRHWPQHFPVSPVSHLAPCFGQQLKMLCNEYLYNNCRHLRSNVLRIPGFRPLLANLAPSFLASPDVNARVMAISSVSSGLEAGLLTHWHPECQENNRGWLPSKRGGHKCQSTRLLSRFSL